AQLVAARQRCRAGRRELSSIRCRGGLGRRAHRLCQGQSRQAPGCSFVRRSSANSIVSDSPIRRRCTLTLFPAILGLHLTLNAFSAGLLVAVTSAGMAQELPRPPGLPRQSSCALAFASVPAIVLRN